MDLGFTQIVSLISILSMKFVNADYRCIGHVCILDSYDKNIQPIQFETNNVNVNFKSIRILKVDDEEFTITLSLYLGRIHLVHLRICKYFTDPWQVFSSFFAEF